MLVEKLGVEADAFIGVNAGFANLFDLGLGQRLAFLLLGRERRSDEQAEQNEREAAHAVSIEAQGLGNRE